MQTKQKQKKWVLRRHKVVRTLLYIPFCVYIRMKYFFTPTKFRQEGKRPYLVLANHQTAFDQFYVSVSFKQPMYYLASEDLFSNGFTSSLIRYLVAPIPIKKQTTDIGAVMNCIRVAREGGSIAIFPEGNRTYSGETVYMSDSIAALAKKLKMPIALYRIEGGYGVQPRWSDGTRKGKMKAYVSRVIEPEEYQDLSREDLFDLIQKGLYANEAVADGTYKSRKRAEYMERAMYICPDCGLSEFESHKNEITCKKCGKTAIYGEDKTFTGKDCQWPFRFVKDWYDYQEQFINKLDVLQYKDQPLYQDVAQVSEVIFCKKKQLLRKQAKLSLYGDRIVLDEGTAQAETWHFDDVQVITVLGRNKLNIYHGKQLFQFKSHKRFNALKYMHIYFRYKNLMRGDSDVEFLGL